MGMQIRDILDSVPNKVLRRGEDYYDNDSILSLKKDKDLVFSGKVSGSIGDYKVKVQMSPNGEVLDYSCTCPYDFGDVCKHIVAVMLAIENHDFNEGMATGNEAGNPMDLERLLQNLPHERLMSIILSHAELDEKFRTDLLLEIGPPDIKADLAVIKQKINYAVSENSSRGFIESDGCEAICDELSQCLALAEKRFGSGLHMAAFEISLYLLLTGADLVSSADSDSVCLAAIVEESIEALSKVCHQVAMHAVSKDKEHCYDKLCKAALHNAFDGWSDWSQEILGIAVLLVSKQNQAGIFDALDVLKSRRTGEEYSDYAQTGEDLTRLKVIRKFEGKQAARAFIDSHLSSDRFRKVVSSCCR